MTIYRRNYYLRIFPKFNLPLVQYTNKIIPYDSNSHETLRQKDAIVVWLKHVVLSSWYTSILLFVTKITDKSWMVTNG